MACDRCHNEAVHCNIISTTGSLPVAVLFVYFINDRQYLVTHSKLGSNLDVGDAPVGDAQVCTVLCMYRMWQVNSQSKTGQMPSDESRKLIISIKLVSVITYYNLAFSFND